MTPQSTTEALTKNPTILIQTLKQKQKVMDLETGDESAEIELVYDKYVAPEYSAKEYGGSEALFLDALLIAASELVQPVSKQIDAFLTKRQSDNYQVAKAKALSGGNFLTADLKGKIVQVMKGNQAFVDMNAADCFKRWKDGYKAQKAGAFKVLETAKALGDFGDDL